MNAQLGIALILVLAGCWVWHRARTGYYKFWDKNA